MTTNVIIADAEYIDNVAFNLIVNFERMIGRHIPPADIAQWVECVGMDGGMRIKANKAAGNGDAPTDNSKDAADNAPTADRAAQECQVLLVHNAKTAELRNFSPAALQTQLNGQAFTGELGEFTFSTVAADEKSEVMTKADIIKDLLAAMADEDSVKRVMVIPDLDNPENGMLEMLMPVLRHLDRECPDMRVTLFAMQPLTGVPCRTEILGYSLMAALGIKSSEIPQ